ncbi:MAG: tRNA uridine-5-carboxymethylaminomethyl(34) synthesis GTPase MnmE [Pseudomonadales bacterium]
MQPPTIATAKTAAKDVVTETIAAIATPGGRGGIGVVRVSGPLAKNIGRKITGLALQPRHAHLADFTGADQHPLDRGLAIYFAAPRSYTGEDVLELQAHGNSFVLDEILQRVLQLGARLARPGEFTERAFLNDKIDLAQAEAIADTIASNSRAAARSAVASLVGEFSGKVHALLDSLTELRTYVEATIDFPEEEIDLPTDSFIKRSFNETLANIAAVLHQATVGNIVREGLSTVIVGAPNAGKSSLLNRLSGDDIAIVSAQAGTTRDMLRADIELAGIPLQLVDTAGLRKSADEIEREGIRRAGVQAARADIVILVKTADSSPAADDVPTREALARELAQFGVAPGDDAALILLYNKIDLHHRPAKLLRAATASDRYAVLSVSALAGEGLDLLAKSVRDMYALDQGGETTFTARQRHIDILRAVQAALIDAERQLQKNGAAELFAEDLRKAQQRLGEITGQFRSDDLLGEIFSTFCIGK